jgi:membrane protease YdiL (CAAX protease family)
MGTARVFDDDDEEEPRPSEGPPEERPMTLLTAFLWFFLATSILQLLLFVTHSARPGASTDLVNGLGCTAVAYLLSVYFMARVHGGAQPLSQLLGVRGTHPLLPVLSGLLGVAIQVPAEMLQRFIERRWPTPVEEIAEQMAALRVETWTQRLVLPVVIACLGPLIEEVFYRGALQRALRRVYPDTMVVPVVALLFALGHGNPRALAPIFVVGLAFGLVRALSGSLLSPLVAHMCFNCVVVIGLLTGSLTIEPDVRPLPWALALGGIAATILLVAAIIFVARRSERAERARQEDLA